MVNVECASVWMNSFFPSRLKKKSRLKKWEKNQLHYAAPINRPCSNSPLNPSDFFFLCYTLFDWPWLTARAQTLKSSIKHLTKEPKRFSFFYLSHVWIVSNAGKQPQHPKVNHRYQSKPVHHRYDDQTAECHRPHTHTAHTHTAPAVRQLRKNVYN